MASFKNNKFTVSEDYKVMGAAKVFLESKDDEFLIGTKWFSHLRDRIEFIAVSRSGTRDAGGGKTVISKVNDELGQGKTAYGVVDRDVLLADPTFRDNLWWNHDDENFKEQFPYGDTIFVLHRWEIENYLLHPEALENLHRDKFRTIPPTPSSIEIANKLIEHENNFIASTLFSTLHHSQFIKDKTQACLRHSVDVKGDVLVSNVKKSTQCTDKLYNEHKERILAFAESETDAKTRWDRISRLLDGKRTCYRIEKLLFSTKSKKVSIEDEMGALANYIANCGLIDPHLSEWLTGIADTQ